MVSLILRTPPAAVTICNLKAQIPTFIQKLPYDNADIPVKRINAFLIGALGYCSSSALEATDVKIFELTIAPLRERRLPKRIGCCGRPIEQVMDDIHGQIDQQVPGLNIGMAQLMEDLIGDFTAVPQPVVIKFFSDNGGNCSGQQASDSQPGPVRNRYG